VSHRLFSILTSIHVLSALAGWGPEVFTAYSHWWVVPVVACHLGAIGKMVDSLTTSILPEQNGPKNFRGFLKMQLIHQTNWNLLIKQATFSEF
jgi:hypothetical protein